MGQRCRANPLDRKPETARASAGNVERSSRGRMAARKGWYLELALAALLVILGVVSLAVGAAGLSVRDAFTGLIDGSGPAGIIVRDIRLPRVLLSLMIGATLGLAGAALQ